MDDERQEFLCFIKIHQSTGNMWWKMHHQYATTPEEAAEVAVAYAMAVGAQYGEVVREIRVVPVSEVRRFEPSGPRPYAVKDSG